MNSDPVQEASADSESRARLVQSIMGKYRDVPTSSELFIQRKHEELDQESDSEVVDQ